MDGWIHGWIRWSRASRYSTAYPSTYLLRLRPRQVLVELGAAQCLAALARLFLSIKSCAMKIYKHKSFQFLPLFGAKFRRYGSRGGTKVCITYLFQRLPPRLVRAREQRAHPLRSEPSACNVNVNAHMDEHPNERDGQAGLHTTNDLLDHHVKPAHHAQLPPAQPRQRRRRHRRLPPLLLVLLVLATVLHPE